MEPSCWQYTGQIDLFGVSEEQRSALLYAWQVEALDGGGELEVAKSDSDLYHTDRFDIRACWSSLSRPFPELMCQLAQIVPGGHPPMEVEGLLPLTGERLGVQIKNNQVFLVTYSMVRGPSIPFNAPAQVPAPARPGLMAA